MKEYAFGIDLGGTTAKIGLFTTTGDLLEKWEVPTDTSDQGVRILPNLAAAVQDKMAQRSLRPTRSRAWAWACPARCRIPALWPSSVPTWAAGATAMPGHSCPSCWAACGCRWATMPM